MISVVTMLFTFEGSVRWRSVHAAKVPPRPSGMTSSGAKEVENPGSGVQRGTQPDVSKSKFFTAWNVKEPSGWTISSCNALWSELARSQLKENEPQTALPTTCVLLS